MASTSEAPFGTTRPSGRAGVDAEPGPEVDPDADHEEIARMILLDQLAGRARSRHELAQRLARRRVPEEIATRLLDRFTEVGLVDDAAFARDWVDQRHTHRGLSRRALAQELRRKGVADDDARTALEGIDDESEVNAARELVRRKLRTVRDLPSDKAVRRLAGMLARKGYSSGIAFRVVREELDADLVDPDLLT